MHNVERALRDTFRGTSDVGVGHTRAFISRRKSNAEQRRAPCEIALSSASPHSRLRANTRVTQSALGIRNDEPTRGILHVETAAPRRRRVPRPVALSFSSENCRTPVTDKIVHVFQGDD